MNEVRSLPMHVFSLCVVLFHNVFFIWFCFICFCLVDGIALFRGCLIVFVSYICAFSLVTISMVCFVLTSSSLYTAASSFSTESSPSAASLWLSAESSLFLAASSFSTESSRTSFSTEASLLARNHRCSRNICH